MLLLRSICPEDLFQIGVRDDLLAAGDEIAEGLALQHAVRQEGEVGNLVKDFIAGREGFDIGPVGLADLFAGLAGGVLLRVGGVGRGLGGELASFSASIYAELSIQPVIPLARKSSPAPTKAFISPPHVTPSMPSMKNT